MPNQAFSPGQTVMLNVAATVVQANIAPGASAVRLLLTGGNQMAFVRIGTGPQTATTSDYPVIPNVPDIIAKPVGADTIAAISSGSSEPLYVTTGELA